MRVLVCGGRTYRDSGFVCKTLDAADVSILICGAQRKRIGGGYVGADWLAIEWALSREIPFIGVPAQWNRYDSAAGPIRNALMVEDWKPDRVIAFPGHQGTRNMINIAKFAGIPVTLAGWE